jgi:hypothetical protein
MTDSLRILMKSPIAWIPIALSMAALTLVLSYVGLFGALRNPDEGGAAHTWQLLMGIQLPVIAFFMAKWLGQAPKQALQVIALQAAAALTAIAPVWFFKL